MFTEVYNFFHFVQKTQKRRNMYVALSVKELMDIILRLVLFVNQTYLLLQFVI
jgi:hypothetical protein